MLLKYVKVALSIFIIQLILFSSTDLLAIAPVSIIQTGDFSDEFQDEGKNNLYIPSFDSLKLVLIGLVFSNLIDSVSAVSESDDSFYNNPFLYLPFVSLGCVAACVGCCCCGLGSCAGVSCVGLCLSRVFCYFTSGECINSSIGKAWRFIREIRLRRRVVPVVAGGAASGVHPVVSQNEDDSVLAPEVPVLIKSSIAPIKSYRDLQKNDFTSIIEKISHLNEILKKIEKESINFTFLKFVLDKDESIYSKDKLEAFIKYMNQKIIKNSSTFWFSIELNSEGLFKEAGFGEGTFVRKKAYFDFLNKIIEASA